MTDDTEQREILYKSSDMATMLKIQESTLRKYCILFEEAGYNFHKNEFGHRAFFNKDVMAFNRFMEIKNHPDMTLKQACDAVVMWVNSGNVTGHDITDMTEKERHDDRYNDLLDKFEEFKEQQQDFNKELLNQLKNQQDYIQNSLLERDKKLMEALRETQETRKLIAVAPEEEENKKKWRQFWT